MMVSIQRRAKRTNRHPAPTYLSEVYTSRHVLDGPEFIRLAGKDAGGYQWVIEMDREAFAKLLNESYRAARRAFPFKPFR